MSQITFSRLQSTVQAQLNGVLGGNASGLEFPTGLPGSEGTNFFAPTAQSFLDYAAAGFKVVRLPYFIERLQPTIGQAFDATYKAYIDQAITDAATAGLKVILEPHNFGRRYVWVNGGFTSDFATTDNKWDGGTQSGGKLQVTNFQAALAGSLTNSGYSFTVKAEINSVDGPDSWRNLWLHVGYQNANNRLHFNLSGSNTSF